MLIKTDINDFSIHTWYGKFKNISLESILIEIPPELLNLFQNNEVDINLEEVCPPHFVANLKNALNEFNNNAFVKNNWHAPMDAKMFSIGNELKVSNLKDLILYLGISNRITNDFLTISDNKFFIVLKPWKNIHPASEFRCIVINNILRGITPRDWPTYYAHFKEDGSNIIELLTNFFDTNIKNKFSKSNYTFDVIVEHPNRPLIVDFGPLNNKTNLYAFTWKEIFPLIGKDVIEEIPPVFRYLESDIGIMTKAEGLHKFYGSV